MDDHFSCHGRRLALPEMKVLSLLAQKGGTGKMKTTAIDIPVDTWTMRRAELEKEAGV